MLNFIDKHEFEKEWKRIEKEYKEMEERNKKFRENWEKNVRNMGAASFFGLEDEVPGVILDSMGSTVNFKDQVVVDVEYKEIVTPVGYLEDKEV